jgi:hypothetical protein
MVVSGCVFYSIARDACRARDTKHVIIDGNFFNRTGDDCIALHTASSTLETFTPIREGLIITNNVMVNTHKVSILGGRRVLFSSNYMLLMNSAALSIASGDGTEGDNALLDIVVQGNIFSDLHSTTSATATAGNAYVAIDADAARSGTAPNDTAPYQYDSGDAAIVRPYNWYQGNNNTAANPVPPAKSVVISDNTFGRSKKAVAAFSEYGVGTVLHAGVAYDPAMTDAIARPAAGIQIATAPPVGLMIASNRIEHTQSAITLPAPTDNHDIKDVVISGNSIFDFTLRGILVGSGSFNCDVLIEGNNITGDVYRDGSNSNIDGTYDANGGLPDGVSVGNCTGVVIRNNNFKAVCRPVFTNADASNIISGNVVRCGVPAATGFSASNKGVGNVMTGNGRYRYILEDSDPTSGTFGALSSVMAGNAASIPTSGWYFRGHIVWNDSPTSGGKVLGWIRLTDGSAHVSGTDWLVMTSV